jgi:hypothetical protein
MLGSGEQHERFSLKEEITRIVRMDPDRFGAERWAGGHKEEGKERKARNRRGC